MKEEYVCAFRIQEQISFWYYALQLPFFSETSTANALDILF